MSSRAIVTRRYVLATLTAGCTALGALLTSAPALAAAPEAPGSVTVQSPVGATKAVVHGVLNPGEEGHPGTYEFLYKKGTLSCEGESKAPESPGVMLGFEGEEVSQELTGLEPDTKYTVCLRAETKGGATAGPATTFTTAHALEAPATTNPAGAITATGGTLLGVLNPGAAAEAGESYEFRYRASASECQGENEVATPREAATGAEGEEVEAKLTELQPNKQYTFCVIVLNAAEETTTGLPVTFTTSKHAPSIEGESFFQVGLISAQVTAQVNMENQEGNYYYLYGTTSAFEAGKAQKTAEVDLPASGEQVAAPASLTGLLPGGEYHFRLVVTSVASEITLGEMLTFNTLREGGQGLPDGRAYEMVTPSENRNAELYVPKGESTVDEGIYSYLPFDVAPDGAVVTYASEPVTGGNGNDGPGLGNQELAIRGAAGGWTQSTIQPAALKSVKFQGFSSDLSLGFITAGNNEEPTEVNLSSEAPGAGYVVPYVRPTGEPEGGSVGPFHPLITTAMPLHRTPAESGSKGVYNFGKKFPVVPVFAGATAGFGDLLFEDNDALLVGDGPVEEELQSDVQGELTKRNEQNEPEDADYLYDSVAGKLALVDVSPEGKVVPNATFGAPEPGPGYGPGFSNVISSDGSRVYWSSLEGANTKQSSEPATPVGVFVRENPGAPQSPLGPHGECVDAGDACTLQVSAGPARYWTSADDGRYAFYTENGALYRYDIEAKAPGEAREILASPGAGVVGVLAAGESGEEVYFAAKGALAPGASAQTCETECNLYLSERDETRFIASLSEQDGQEAQPFFNTADGTHAGDWQSDLGLRTSEVSANGGVLVFQSNQSLPVVGYPYGFPSDGAEEVYLYEAASTMLRCVSCSASGEAPRGGAFLPISWANTFQMRLLSDEGGRVFFDSDTPLVAQDTNGTQDVYEWERDGLGSCTGASAVDGGCTYLLSGGTSSEYSWLIGASESGDDVFIATRAQLVPEDQNEAFDLYDARVGGVRRVSPPACTGTGCQGVPASPPTFATPSSVTYGGVGNFPASAPAVVKPKPKSKPAKCKKGFTKKHNKCVKAKAKKKAKAKRASRERRGK